MAPNKHKGETVATIAGREFLLRPDFDALVRFETKTGTTVFEAIDQVTRGRAPAAVVAAAIHAGVVAGWQDKKTPPPTFAEIGELCFEHGVVNALPDAITFLRNCMAGSTELARMADAELAALQGKEPAGAAA